MRKTKIICTLGPATDDMKIMEQLVESGMNVARINFSHGTHEEQGKRMQMVRDVRRKYNKHVAILLDTKGPEIRIGNFENGRIELKAGDEFYLCCEDILGNQNSVSVTYKELYKDIEPGTRILIDDGLIEMFVESIEGKRIKCRVQNSGVILNHKGVNIPGVHANLPYMSEKDRDDILFGIDQDVDIIAASFVRTKEDVLQIRHLLEQNSVDIGEGGVVLDYSTPNAQIASQLISGKTRYAVVPEPFITVAKSKSKNVTTALDFQKEYEEIYGKGETYPLTVMVVRKAYAEENKEILNDFLKSYEASYMWTTKNPLKAGKLSEKYQLGLSADIVAKTIPNANYTFISAANAQKQIETLLSVFNSYDAASFGGLFPGKDFYYSGE